VKMCGRFTNKLTWTEIVALYRLTMDRPPHNMRADYNVCPTDPVDTIVELEGQRDLVQKAEHMAAPTKPAT
jgi:putative SOS response-associated peptidase YedK